MIISGLLFIHGGEPEWKNKCLTLFSATTRLLWQHFLLAWACRSEFDGEVICVCTLPSQVFFQCSCTLEPPSLTFCSDLWPLLYLEYVCFVGTSLQVQPLEKHQLSFGILQKWVTLLPNQYMGVTVYPQSHHSHSHTISPSTSAPGEGGIQVSHQTLILVAVQTHFLCVYTYIFNTEMGKNRLKIPEQWNVVWW